MNTIFAFVLRLAAGWCIRSQLADDSTLGCSRDDIRYAFCDLTDAADELDP